MISGIMNENVESVSECYFKVSEYEVYLVTF